MITVVIITYHTRIVDNIDGSPNELKCACNSRISAFTLISPSLTGPGPCGTLDSGTNDVTGPSFPLWIQKKTPSTPSLLIIRHFTVEATRNSVRVVP